MLTKTACNASLAERWITMMSSAMLCSILFTLIGFRIAQAYPTDASAGACADIGHVTNADSQDLGSNPFLLSLSELDHSYGGSVYYVPARTYTSGYIILCST